MKMDWSYTAERRQRFSDRENPGEEDGFAAIEKNTFGREKSQ